MNSPTALKTLLRPEVRLSQYCTMQVGGPARWFAEPSSEEELSDLIEYARQENIPFMILGKGSNVIFPDAGYKGLVITLIHFEQSRILFDEAAARVRASAGIYLYRLVLALRDRGLGGAEFLANIPGTLGGALVMNAGFSRFEGQKNEIADIVREVRVMNPDGSRETLAGEALQFSYRRSNLEGRIVLEGTLQLWRRPAEEIQREVRMNFEYRNGKQDLKHPSSGSVFKNPEAPWPSAGRLIESLGLKGMRVGDAMVSEKHGNYFINAGRATCADMEALLQKVQKAVEAGAGIRLEPEVRFIRSEKSSV